MDAVIIFGQDETDNNDFRGHLRTEIHREEMQNGPISFHNFSLRNKRREIQTKTETRHRSEAQKAKSSEIYSAEKKQEQLRMDSQEHEFVDVFAIIDQLMLCDILFVVAMYLRSSAVRTEDFLLTTCSCNLQCLQTQRADTHTHTKV